MNTKRGKIIIISVVLIILIALYTGIYLWRKSVQEREQRMSNTEGGNLAPSFSPDTQDTDVAKDPVSGIMVSLDKAPYNYIFMGRTYYFASEENLKKFIDDPYKYSGIRFRTNVNVKIRDEAGMGQETPFAPSDNVDMGGEIPTDTPSDSSIPDDKCEGGAGDDSGSSQPESAPIEDYQKHNGTDNVPPSEAEIETERPGKSQPAEGCVPDNSTKAEPPKAGKGAPGSGSFEVPYDVPDRGSKPDSAPPKTQDNGIEQF